MMCQAVATEMNASVLWVSLADITSKYTGESEKYFKGRKNFNMRKVIDHVVRHGTRKSSECDNNR